MGWRADREEQTGSGGQRSHPARKRRLIRYLPFVTQPSLDGDGDVHIRVNGAGEMVRACSAEGHIFGRAGAERHARISQFGGTAGVGVAFPILANANHVRAAGILRINHVQRLASAQGNAGLREAGGSHVELVARSAPRATTAAREGERQQEEGNDDRAEADAHGISLSGDVILRRYA